MREKEREREEREREEREREERERERERGRNLHCCVITIYIILYKLNDAPIVALENMTVASEIAYTTLSTHMSYISWPTRRMFCSMNDVNGRLCVAVLASSRQNQTSHDFLFRNRGCPYAHYHETDMSILNGRLLDRGIIPPSTHVHVYMFRIDIWCAGIESTESTLMTGINISGAIGLVFRVC